ncbi:MAG: pseudouridine synthase [Pirellulaceae bacterium]
MFAQARRPGTRASKSSPAPGPGEGGQRLQKVLAAAGIASRRECEERIREGRVEVDRVTVTELGTRVDPLKQEIRVDGVPLARPHHVYYMVHKPVGVLSTNWDPDRRLRVIDLVPGDTRLFTVGRLDRSSEGLILVTNDGELANLLTHPRYGIPKTYRASVLGFPTAETLQKLRKGVHLAEGVARVAEIRARGRHARGAELEIVLTEGRNREIRRVLARVEHKVLRLRRIAIGPLRLGNLAAGEARRLTGAEVQQLRESVHGPKKGRGAAQGAPVPGAAGRRAAESGRPAETGQSRRVREPAPAGRPRSGPKSRRPPKTAARQAQIGQTKAAQSKTAQGKTGQVKTAQGKAGQGKAGQGKAVQTPTSGSATRRPRTGAVLDYGQPPASGAKRPAHKHPSKKSSPKGKRR